MWNNNWNLKEGYTIGSGLVLTGLLLQFTIGPVVWGAFAWPANIITLGIFLVLLGIATILKEKIYLIKFGLSYASAIPAITYAVVLTIIMGVTRQSNAPTDEDPLGITSCLTFWPFVLIYIWIAWIVGFTAIHQIVKLIEGAKKNSRFSILNSQFAALVSHLGLFMVLVCGTLGSADMQRLKMYCEPGNPEWRALDNANKVHELPVAIQLDSFIIDEYPPKLTLVENKTMKAVEIGGKPLSVLIDKDFKSVDMGGWNVTVEQVLDNAAPRMTADTTTYVDWPVNGACCAVLVKATKDDDSMASPKPSPVERDVNNSSSPTGRSRIEAPTNQITGWVSCGSYRLPSQLLTLDNTYSIGMAQREPQRFASKVHVYSEQGDNIETVIEVNKPLSINGWKIYQYSYNEQMGKWSNYSVFELVTDPWLPVVYIGIALIAIGALCMFFGNRRKEVDNVG